MIPLQRPVPDRELTARLTTKTTELTQRRAKGPEAREAWRGARTIRRDLRALLEGMAPGLGRCMYCGDSHGTDIDHFAPLAHAPLHAFEWLNHLLACAHCNSNEKREQYPCDEDGTCLLIDPSREDPYLHLKLTLPTGEYTPLTAKGRETIRVFGLSRPILAQGRAKAYVRCKSMLRDCVHLRATGDEHEAAEVADSLRVQPFSDVLYAMVRYMHTPGAAIVMGESVVAALRRWESAFTVPHLPAQRTDVESSLPKEHLR